MASQDCIDAVKAAVGDKLTDEEIAEVIEAVERRRRFKAAHLTLEDATEVAIAAARELADETRLAAIIEKRSRAINVLRRQRRQARYGARPGQEAQTLSALNVGSERGFEGAALSVDAERLALEAELLGGLVAELRRDGVLRLVQRRTLDFERDVSREMWRLTDGVGTPTNNRAAERVARVFVKYQEAARLMQNEAGAWIGKTAGYIVRQTHDQYRIAKAGFAAWRDAILPKLDAKTFAEVDDVETFLKEVWTNLATGVHLKSHGGGDWLGGFKGPGNLAKRASQERVLHFKSADDWFDYNQQFGSRSLLEGVIFGLHSAARNTALMRTWGTNPEAAFLKEVDELIRATQAAGDLKAVKDLTSRRTRAKFDAVNGALSIPENVSLAMWVQTVRNWLSMAKLGGVVVSSIPDISARASAIRHNGVNLLDGYRQAIMDVVTPLSGTEQREFADLLGVGIDGLLGSVLSRFSATDSVPGKMSKLMDTFFRLNLLTFWTDAHTAGHGLMLSRHLAMNADRRFGELHPDLRLSLERYGIDEARWEVLRQAPIEMADGKAYMMPDAVVELADAAFDPLISREVARLRGAVDEDLAARRATDLAQREREAGWVNRRVEKFQTKLKRAEERLAAFESRRGAKAADLGERVELMRVGLAGAQVKADILGSLSGLDSRDAARRFLDEVERGADAYRVAKKSDRRIERDLGRAMSRGEKLGARQGRAEARIAALKRRIAAAGREIESGRQDFIDYFTEKQAELESFIAEIGERQKRRVELLEERHGELERKIGRSTDRMRREARRDLTTALRAYYAEQTRSAMTFAGARERALMTFGTKAGTPHGEAVRFFMQFKAFPITFATRHLGREFLRRGALDKSGLAALIVGNTVLGYVSMTAKELLKGREPRQPEDAGDAARIFLDAMQHGGGLGIYGDFLFGQYNRFGQSPVATLGGPAVGVFEDVMTLYGKAMNMEDPSAEAARLAINNTPFVNLFYTRMALDYLVLYHVQEWLNPGYLRRMEKRIAKDNAQGFWLPPSETIRNGGGFQ